MGDYTPQEVVDMLHKTQSLQGVEVGKMWTHILDLKTKVEKLEAKEKFKRPIYINITAEGLD